MLNSGQLKIITEGITLEDSPGKILSGQKFVLLVP